jgi:hypothetical protein
MKKILFAVMAMIAIGFTSCGNKQKANTDAIEQEANINAEQEAAATIDALTEQIEAKDANKLQEVLATVKEKIASFITSDPEAAKEYVADQAYDPNYGARPVKRYLQSTLETELARRIIEGQIYEGCSVIVDKGTDGLDVKVAASGDPVIA